MTTQQTWQRLAEHLASEVVIPDGMTRCELTADSWGDGRCEGQPAAVRWEDGFADIVCQHHAETAQERGALVVFPRRHDGSQKVAQ